MSDISPNTGPSTGGITVTLTGTGFVSGITEVCFEDGSSGLGSAGTALGRSVGAVLVVGNSLSVGSGPYLVADVPNRFVTVNARVGRPTSEGVAIIQSIATLPPVLLVELGTNDGPDPGLFTTKIDAIMAKAGATRPVYWVDIWRSGYGSLNSALDAAAVAHSNLTIIHFAATILSHPEMIGPDGLHLNGSGYQLMGQAEADAIGPGTAPPSGGAGYDVALAAVTEAVSLTSTPANWITGLMTIAQRESNYDCSAVNNWDSNAQKGVPSKGLMQTIDPTFNAYALPGHGDIFNCVDNAAAAIGYIKARYGDIVNVQQSHPELPPKGY